MTMINEEIRTDIDSLARVRNRLSTAPDTKLPSILPGLLPRLMKRLESYHEHAYDYMALEAQNRVFGIFHQALERIRGNVDISVDDTVKSVVPYLTARNPGAGIWSLVIIQGSIARCSIETAASIVAPTLIRIIDELHSETAESSSAAASARLTSASWLFLDCIAVGAGLKPLIDWAMDCFDEKALNWKIHKSQTWGPLCSEPAAEAANLDGAGIFHLILDLMLFLPGGFADIYGISRAGQSRLCHRSRVHEEEQQNLRDAQRRRQHQQLRWNPGAVARFGPRQTVQNDKWSDMALRYLRHLKLLSLRSVIWPRERCLFQRENSEKALILAVLSSRESSMHGQLASDYVAEFSGDTFSSARNYQNSKQMYSLNTAVAFLVLMVGYEPASPLLGAFEKQFNRNPWSTILGKVSYSGPWCRPPLPAAVSFRAARFLLDHGLLIDENKFCEGELQLLMDLTMLFATQFDGGEVQGLSDERKIAKSLSIQLCQNFFQPLMSQENFHTADPLISSVMRLCLAIATEVISLVVEIGEKTVEQAQVGGLPLRPGGVEAPFGHRVDLNRLLNTHRAQQKRRKLSDQDAIQARRVAYEMIESLATQYEYSEEQPFQLPVCLLRCAMYEDKTLIQFVRQANSAILDVYRIRYSNEGWKRAVDKGPKQYGSSRQQFVLPLLPALLDAVCSESSQARLLAIDWLRNYVHNMDSEASCYLVRFLLKDPDPVVASLVQKNFHRMDKPLFTPRARQMVEYLDLADKADFEKVKVIASQRANAMAEYLDTTFDTAASLLADFSFSETTLREAFELRRTETLENCGLAAPNDNNPSDDVVFEEGICGICYETFGRENSFSLECGHYFCKECWIDFIEAAEGAGKYACMALRCPQKDCNRQVLKKDFEVLDSNALGRWERAFVMSFVTNGHTCGACPSVDCNAVAVVRGRRDQSPLEASCIQCHTTFCIDCGARSHHPATCDAVAEWTQSQSESEFWVRKNSKPCPGCNARIEKDQGCNHMTCTNCNVQFCWLCLTQLTRHSETHTCNRYSPSDDAQNDDQRRALFVAERFDAHAQAGNYAESQFRKLDEKPTRLVETFDFLTSADEEILSRSLQTLWEARKYLQNSYVASFGLRHNPTALETLENYQSSLEILTERLSQLTETNLQYLYAAKGESALVRHFKGLDFYRISVMNYTQRFTDALFPIS